MSYCLNAMMAGIGSHQVEFHPMEPAKTYKMRYVNPMEHKQSLSASSIAIEHYAKINESYNSIAGQSLSEYSFILAQDNQKKKATSKTENSTKAHKQELKPNINLGKAISAGRGLMAGEMVAAEGILSFNPAGMILAEALPNAGDLLKGDIGGFVEHTADHTIDDAVQYANLGIDNTTGLRILGLNGQFKKELGNFSKDVKKQVSSVLVPLKSKKVKKAAHDLVKGVKKLFGC